MPVVRELREIVRRIVLRTVYEGCHLDAMTTLEAINGIEAILRGCVPPASRNGESAAAMIECLREDQRTRQEERRKIEPETL